MTFEPGSNYQVTIFGSWPFTQSAFTIGLLYDEDNIEIEHVTIPGPITPPIEVFDWNIPEPGALWVGLVWQFGHYPPPGSYILVYLYISTSNYIEPGEYQLEFGIVDVPPIPPIYCAYLDEYDNIYYPEVIDGFLTVVYPNCGDMNNDSSVNIADLTYLVSYLFQGGDDPTPYLCVADVNNDDSINIADLTYMVAYLFQGGPEPNEFCCNPVW